MEKKIFQDIVDNGPKPPVAKTSFLSKERREERKGKILSDVFEIREQDKSVYKTHGKKFWATGIVAFFVLGGILLTTTFARAYINIIPNQENVELDSTFKIYKNSSVPHLLGYSIISVSGEEVGEVKAGNLKYVERKAFGKIIVYNEFSKEPFKLIENTRFKAPRGEIFKTYKAITIPGYTLKNNSLIPGKIEISVTAEKPGQSYNIGPSDFSLPGLSGGPISSKVYARSVESFEGGFEGQARKVEDEAMSSARSSLETALLEKLLIRVSQSISPEQIFFPDSYSFTSVFKEFDDENTPDLNITTQKLKLEGNLHALIFDKKVLAEHLAKREAAVMGDSRVLIHNWEEVSMDLSNYDNVGQAQELTTRFQGPVKFVWQFDEEKLKNDLAGLEKSAYNEIFINYPAIDRAEVKIKPFWKKSFPTNKNSIKITTTL